MENEKRDLLRAIEILINICQFYGVSYDNNDYYMLLNVQELLPLLGAENLEVTPDLIELVLRLTSNIKTLIDLFPDVETEKKLKTIYKLIKK